MRYQYEQNLKNKPAQKRYRYKQNLKNERARMQYRYKHDLENKRAQKRIRYSKYRQNEQNRQKKIDLDHKWLYNKQYYEKNKKSILAIKSHDIRKRIIKKYKKFCSKNTIKLHHSLELFIENIIKKLNIKGHIFRNV